MNRLYQTMTIAGFDGSGGAGIQADLKTFSALGCYGTTVLTALPVQNTTGVKSVYDISARCVEEQLKSIFDDIKIDAVKIGMVHRKEIVEVIANMLRIYNPPNIVLDPVMVAKSGDRLLTSDAISAMIEQLFPITTVLTPNLLEASEILGREIRSRDQMEQAAIDLLKLGPQAVVVKGGHSSRNCDDCLCLKNNDIELHWLPEKRIKTRNTHGTGCTFSAAIAAYLAKGKSIIDSVRLAKEYVTKSIEAGAHLQIGLGNGPVHHFHYLWSSL